MEKLTTRNLKIKHLGIIPVLKQEMGFFNSQEIVSFSALLTFKGKSVQSLLKDSLKKGEGVEERIKKILRKSSLKGHASLSTTPVISFLYEGSKFLDSLLTGIYFGSFLVSSGRRTNTDIEDIVYPNDISENKQANEVYKEVSEKNVNFYKSLLEKDVKKETASKILQYGIYGTGIVQLPLESFISLKKEYEAEGEWMPEETGLLIQEIEEKLKEMGIDLLYSTRLIAPKNIYPYPNIFKDPEEINLTRELIAGQKLEKGFKIISTDIVFTPKLKDRLNKLKNEIEKAARGKEETKSKWQDLLSVRRKILRDYNSAFNMKILSSVPWRVWGEKKRHRTCPQVVESIYFCTQRAVRKLNEFEDQIRNKDINSDIVEQIEQIMSIPALVKEKPDFLEEYLLVALESFQGYEKLIKLGIKPRDAVFLIPRAVKVDVLQEYNLYNLLAGYYPLRLCQTAEEEMRRNTLREVAEIKEVLEQKGHGWLNDFIVPKCQTIGFCPEIKSCGQIKSLVKDYDDEFHNEMKEDLEQKYQKTLKEVNKD